MNNIIWIGFIFFGMVLTGCDSEQNITSSDNGTSISENISAPEESVSTETPDSTAAGQPQSATVAGLFESSDLVVTASFTGMGEIVGHGNGVIDLGDGMVIDDTAYYIEYLYQIDEVLQGDSALAGTEIAVLEYLGMGEEAAGMQAPQAEYSEGTQQMLFMAEDDGEYYFVNADTARVALSEDGVPEFPETLTDADDYATLDALRALAE